MKTFGTVGLRNNHLTLAIYSTSLLLFLGCEEKSSAPSDCYYETVETLAEVIDMKPHPDGNGRIAIVMDFKASVLALEDQELGALKSLEIDHEFLERNNIQLNSKYEATVSELVKGDCDTKLTVAFHHAFE